MASTLPHDRIWDNAERTVVELERASRTASLTDLQYFNLVADRLATLADRSVVTVAVQSCDKIQRLSCSDPTTAGFAIDPDVSDASHWAPTVPEDHAKRSVVAQRLEPGLRFVIAIDWEADLGRDSANRRTITDATKAIIEFASAAYLRWQLYEIRQRVAAEHCREQRIATLLSGTTLGESAYQIASSIAAHHAADRVLITAFDGRRCRLIGNSTSAHWDRRANLVTLLEALLPQTTDASEPITFTVGAGKQASAMHPDCKKALDAYINESGCRQIEINVIRDATDGNGQSPDRESCPPAVAMTVVEWFRVPDTPVERSLDPFVRQAIIAALARDQAGWPAFAKRIRDATLQGKSLFLAATAGLTLVALTIVPATLWIPVEGVVVPELHRRLFAPVDAMVSEITVRDGEAVLRGQPLIILRSPAIDLQEEQVRGALVTAKTRLASLGASRSGNHRSPGDAAESFQWSSSEESLKAEIDGLEKQLVVIESQQTDLTITSPIDGMVDRWDLTQTLTMRPVAQGQFLIDVYAPDADWVAQWALPDSQTGYLSNADHNAGRIVRFRMQSRPDRRFVAELTDIAESAHLDPQGRSFVRLRSRFVPPVDERPGMGAAVSGEIDCGKRSLGFVWFRGLFEWWDRQCVF